MPSSSVRGERPTWLWLLPMIGLCLLSLWWWPLRMLFADNAFQTFLLINDGYIEVMVHRYPAIIVRVLPYLAVLAEASLDTIMQVFSLSYGLFHLAIAALLLWRYRAADLVWVMIAIHVGLSRHAFFWNVSELLQVMSFVLLVVAEWRERDFGWSRVAACQVAVALLWHPQALMLFGAVLLCHLEKPRIKRIVAWGLGIAGLWLVKSIALANYYDRWKWAALEASWEQHGMAFWEIDSLELLIGYQWDQAVLLGLGIGVGSVLAWRRRELWRWVALLCYGAVLFLLFFYQNSGSATNTSYAEPSHLAAVFGLVYYIVYRGWRAEQSRAWLWAGLGLAVYGLVGLTVTQKGYSERLKLLEEITAIDGQKICYKLRGDQAKTIQHPWALPYETMLYTTLHGKATKTIVDCQNSEAKAKTWEKNQNKSLSILNDFESTYKLSDNALQYFPLRDSTYHFIVK